jgi:hypothetical protein
MERVLEIIGLGTPFIFGAATFWVFHWLDRNASAKATRSISAWLKSRPLEKFDAGDATISLFDRVYSSPLFRFRAFGRSAIISLFNWAAFLLPGAIFALITMPHNYNQFTFVFRLLIDRSISNAIIIVIADYISLFAVRKTLLLSRQSPLKAIALAFTAGVVIIIISYILFNVILATMFWFTFTIENTYHFSNHSSR